MGCFTLRVSIIACSMNFKIGISHTVVRVRIDGPDYFKSFYSYFHQTTFNSKLALSVMKCFWRQNSRRDGGSLYQSNLLLRL